MPRLYTTIVSDRLVPTVNFYEDNFGFVPAIEKDGYVLLRQDGNPSICIAVFDIAHQHVSDLNDPTKGVIVNVVVPDVKTKYDDLYMEGLDIRKEYGTDINGPEHFVVCDPNGIWVNVHAPFAPA